jgi:glutathione S-transferase
MDRITLFGAAYSVYVRIVRLVLEEIRIPYDLVEVDILAKDNVPADYADRHPFGRIPAFEHDGFRLFETDAIVSYVLECFGKGALLPSDVKDRARTRQIMRIMDNYGYRALVWGIYVEEMERNRAGQLQLDELERARTCLRVVEDLAAADFLIGARLTLADLWTLPMLTYLKLAPTGRALLSDAPKLSAWLERMQSRPSVQTTRVRGESAAG